MDRHSELRRTGPIPPGKGFKPRETSLPRGKLTRNSPSLPRAPFRAGRGGGETPQRSSTGLSQSVREKVYKRDDNRCGRCGREVYKGWRSVHHRVPRSAGGRAGHDRLSALITVCGVLSTDPDTCHYVIERFRTEAQASGYLVPMGIDPEKWGVKYHDGWFRLDDDGKRVACPEWGGVA